MISAMSALGASDGTAVLLPPLAAAELADYCLRATGPGHVQLIGAELGTLESPFRLAGCEVVSSESGTALSVPSVAIAWITSANDHAMVWGWELDTLMVVAPSKHSVEADIWVARAAEQGWRQHPAAFVISSATQDLSVRLLARHGVEVSDPESLQSANYHGLAAALVHPGDAVVALDAAKGGLWRILLQHSRCRWLGVPGGGAQSAIEPGLEWLEDTTWKSIPKPVDLMVMRLSDNQSRWREEIQGRQAPLGRGGRMVIMVPAVLAESAQQPALHAALQQHGLAIDRVWKPGDPAQFGASHFVEIARDSADQLAIDSGNFASDVGLVLLAAKVEGPGLEQNSAMGAPNIIAFQRDYLDASLVGLIVAAGLRLESAGLRRQIARRAMLETPSESADYGAAVCVLLYDPVAVEGDGRAELLAAARRYIEGPAVNPTALRWQVSLAFASASLHQSSGELQQAAELYARVLAFDVLSFSPLLGTKTTAAAVRLGWIQFADGNLAAARQSWARGLEEARRLTSQPDWTEAVGDPEAPETFAMPEFAAVMDEAGCLASALRLTAELPLRPGLAWQWANRSWRMQLEQARMELQRREQWHTDVQHAKDWLDSQYHQLNTELVRREQVIQELDSQKQALATDNNGVRAAYRLAHLHAVMEKATLTQHLHASQEEQARLSSEHQRLVDANERLIGAHQELTDAYYSLTDTHQQLIGTHQQLISTHQELIGAAQHLSAATGAIMGSRDPGPLPAEAIAGEMSRLASALNRLPMKTLVRTLLRALAAALGRKEGHGS